MRKINKISIIIPVYYNEDNLIPLYEDIREKFINKIDYDYEIIMVDDGSKDNSIEVMKKLKLRDSNIKIIRLARNFGSHAAMLCGLNNCSGDCAVIKCADLQEPTELIIEMVEQWQKHNNVVLAVREGREESKSQEMFANLYYSMVKNLALPNMPDKGFDVYLLDRKVIDTVCLMNERNSALTGQVLWSGFTTAYVYYTRKKREVGKSRWTLKKKIRLVMDSLFSFSNAPIVAVEVGGIVSLFGAFVWIIIEIILKLSGHIAIQGWTLLMIFQLFSFGIIMLTLGILGEYLWRTFDASRNRPAYIVEYLDEELMKAENFYQESIE